MKNRILKIYNSFISFTIALLDARFFHLFSYNKKNGFVIEYGTPRADYCYISNSEKNDGFPNETTNQSDWKKSRNNINDIYRYIGGQLTDNSSCYAGNENSCLFAEDFNYLFSDEALNQNISETRTVMLDDNNCKETVIRY